MGRTTEQRVEELADPNTGRPAGVHSTAFRWDTAPNGVGQLHWSASPDGVVKAFGYDRLGRAVVESTVRNGVEHVFKRSFDDAGRLDVLTYPEARLAGRVGQGATTRVQYVYNEINGSLSRVRNADNPTQVFWEALARDDSNRITLERFGQLVETTRTWNQRRGWIDGITTKLGSSILQQASYVRTPGGFVKERRDGVASGGAFTETFGYDALNRLETWCVRDVAGGSANCSQAAFGVKYEFSDNGNLTGRKTFMNGAANSPVEDIRYAYPSAGAPRPHAVRTRRWEVGNGSDAEFKYDGAGRQWERPGQVVTYNAFDLPEKIVSGGATTTYLYDAEGGRYEKKTVFGPTLTRRTTYVGGLYEVRQDVGSGPQKLDHGVRCDSPRNERNLPP
ncbi:MAG: hypothetical protein KA712_09600 [Myxococcales bacterium]|nr:hypothetical protein [Myxococcales bacterium]